MSLQLVRKMLPKMYNGSNTSIFHDFFTVLRQRPYINYCGVVAKYAWSDLELRDVEDSLRMDLYFILSKGLVIKYTNGIETVFLNVSDIHRFDFRRIPYEHRIGYAIRIMNASNYFAFVPEIRG